MACESCRTKFTLFKRKKQCMDCLRYFCSECVIKRFDKMLSCNSCSILSQRPLVRSQIIQLRCRDLRQYLLAKKVSIKGCVEKEDLIKLLITFANGSNNCSNTENLQNLGNIGNLENVEHVGGYPSSSTTDIQYERVHRPRDFIRETDVDIDRVQIEEISDTNFNLEEAPEPLISEEVEVSETPNVHHSDMFTEIPVWSDLVKLSDINTLTELEYLTVKQLKNLLNSNRVDYKGCVERCELLDKAYRLWREHNQSRSEVEQLDENLCKICWDAPIECVILECGHIVSCINCGKQMSECPICKQYVVRVVRFFKA